MKATMSPEELALFPYLPEALDYVKALDFSIDSLMTSIAFESTRKRGFQRLTDAFDGEVSKPSSFGNDNEMLTEFLSYPYARILISCFNETAFIRRYALAEAKAAYSYLKKIVDKEPAHVLEIGKAFKITAFEKDGAIQIYFADYIRHSLSMRDISWKLINRPLEKGYVTVGRDEFVRLLQDAIRKNIENSLPIQDIPDEIKTACAAPLAELSEKYSSQKIQSDDDFGEVEFTLFPPCILKAIASVKEGVNLAHSMRFAMVSFLLNIGMSVDDVVGLFNVSPDFVEEKTRYQVAHIAGNEYKTPACATMQTYGNCAGRDNLCGKIKHPLRYYSFKKFIAAENAAAEAEKIEPERTEQERNETDQTEAADFSHEEKTKPAEKKE